MSARSGGLSVSYETLGMGDGYGQLGVGDAADLVWLARDPRTADSTDTAGLTAAWVGGERLAKP